ncbi:hypothetical protein LuPra_05453 [Luteitalea pratensis]|uniref:Glycosyltransferase RgtA/B/C/D-like domain-containing protein n=1 Tax=Luteitalea pratensis TaxID=1855912 RepID=A0A143PVW2_LUTPR|nr:hypothetical protein [Luteitalea pratensis]AMY12180.1 hypothetical protein LuPra_05453 [Luteitalea pratensis]
MRRVLLAATVMWLLVMVSLAAPRRVGDASEYVAMAGRLADMGAPTFSARDMAAFTAAWAGTGTGFELQTRQLPELQGHDGRWDMPHMWLYPLLSVPFVWIARIASVGDPWGLVALNVSMVAGLLWLAARRGAGPWTLTLFASPLVWWLDKPLADLLIACAVGGATLLWPHPVSLVLLGLAAAQNPALLVGCVVFGLCALTQDRSRIASRRWQLAVAIGAAGAVIAPIYYLSRLDRLSPLTSYAAASWPSLTSLLFPLADVNMGVLPRFPPVALVVMVALLQRRGWREPAALPAALTGAALLLVISQQPNMNQGGSPDLSRYIVWLLPLALPWLLALDRSARQSTRMTGTLVLAVTAVWTAIAFLPSRPESYRYPTPFATWVWTQHPSWTMPRAEAFGERTSHREPAIVPTATPNCEKVLLFEGRWPSNCPPSTSPPPSCAAPGTYCYADRVTGEPLVPRQFTVIGPLPQYGPVMNDRTWPSGDASGQWIESRVRHLSSGEQASAPASVRGAWSVAWTQSWSSDRALVVYVRDAGQGAQVAIRNRGPLLGLIETVDGRVFQRLMLEATTDTPATIELPAAPHLLVSLWPRPGP